MQIVEMSDAVWSELLSRRNRRVPHDGGGTAAERLYGPLAGAARSFVMAQVGQSLDGRVATPSGDARDISGPEGIRHLHRCRALMDAVLVGSGTVIADDPRLSVREVTGPDPVRVVIDRRGELTGRERLLRDGGSPVLVLQGESAALRSLSGCEVLRLRETGEGLDPRDILDVLSARGLDRVLVEGGARTIARFMARNLVDRLHVCIAPLIIGSGRPGLQLPPIERLSSALRPPIEVYGLGGDVLFDCDLAGAGGGQPCPSLMARLPEEA
ncbi:RibD family protein [Gellertiella hungarica]|uniref:Riboflavin-specific deaminase-like protein n=1 Tax=Gellertiella hungarica TaxID=1572859 RepID=A0A7W6NIU9_9HYPH|nr:RibD family protein [Gellertiella hungarica]MBB4063710.1 riboflavin-specific deaminase-like protein [Gellertiella hungarica]